MTGARFASLVLAGSAFLAAFAARADAQCRLCSSPTTTPTDTVEQTKPLTVEVLDILDFDRLILERESVGQARLAPDGTRAASGSIGTISGRAVVARIRVQGDAGRPVSVVLPDSISLHGLKGGTVRIDSVLSDLPRNPALDGNGELFIQIGGVLVLQGDLDGEFRGDLAIDVDYL